MSKVETAVSWLESIANDNLHGYDQVNRWGPDYDCSSLVITAFQKAGIPVKDLGATYTGNMYAAFKQAGFIAYSYNQSQLKRGDVLLNHVNHTAVYIGNGKLVQASGNEKGGITGGKTGDQTGGEIQISNVYNYPWDVVLRFEGEAAEELPWVVLRELVRGVMVGTYGNGDQRKQALGDNYEAVQKEINHILYDDVTTIAKEVIQGRYGNGTYRKDILGTRYNEIQERVNQLL